MVQKNGRILPLGYEICAFLVGVIECKYWKVWKFTLFCSDFAKSLVLGHK